MDDDFAGALTALGAAPPAPAPAAASPTAPSNNPGNLRPTGSSTGFQSFKSPEDGLAAMDNNLKAYGSKGINTISGVINRWAPPSENDTGAYVADVSKRLGVDPNAQIDLGNPIVRHALTTAITLHENGSRILTTPRPAGQPQPQPDQPAQPTSQDSDFSGALAALTGAKAAAQATPQAAPQSTPAAPAAPAQPYSEVRDRLSDLKAGALGLMHGVDNTVAGGLQLAGHAAASLYPDGMPGSDAVKAFAAEGDKQVGLANQQFANATQGHEQAAGVGDVTGGIVGAALVPESKGAEATNLANKLIYAAKTGAKAGAAQAVDPSEQDFWKKKLEQTAVGAAGGVVGVPVAAAAGKIAGAVADKAVGAKNYVLGKLGMAAEDAAAPAAAAAAPSATSSVTSAPGAAPTAAVSPATAAQPAANAPKATADILKASSPEMQQGVQAKLNQGEKLHPTGVANQAEAQNLPVPVTLTKGQASQDPMTISAEQNTRSQNPSLVDRFNDQNKQLVQNLNHIRDTGAPEAVAPDHITAAETLINSGQSVLDKQKAQTTAAYKALTDANGGNLPMDGATFSQAASQALDQQMKTPFLPKEVQGIMDQFKPAPDGTPGKQMTFANFENLRTILAAEGRKADRAGDGNAEGAINIVRNTLEQMPIEGEAANIKPLADAARQSAKQGFDMVRDIPLLKAIDSGKTNTNTLIQNYVVGGQRSDLVNLANTLKDDPVALQTLKAGTINYLKSKAAITDDRGNFASAGYNKALQAMGPKLDVLFSPEEAAQLKAVGNVARNIDSRPKGSYVNTSNTDVANLARAGAGVVEHGINAVTGTPLGSIGGAVVRSSIAGKQSARALNDLLSPAAGTTVPNPTNEKLSRVLSQLHPAATLGALGGSSLGSKPAQSNP